MSDNIHISLEGENANDYIDFLAKQRAREQIGKLVQDALLAMEEIILVFHDAFNPCSPYRKTYEEVLNEANKKRVEFKQQNHIE